MYIKNSSSLIKQFQRECTQPKCQNYKPNKQVTIFAFVKLNYAYYNIKNIYFTLRKKSPDDWLRGNVVAY